LAAFHSASLVPLLYACLASMARRSSGFRLTESNPISDSPG